MSTDDQNNCLCAAAEIMAKGNKDVSLSNADRLAFYALHKQATEGPCTGT